VLFLSICDVLNLSIFPRFVVLVSVFPSAGAAERSGDSCFSPRRLLFIFLAEVSWGAGQRVRSRRCLIFASACFCFRSRVRWSEAEARLCSVLGLDSRSGPLVLRSALHFDSLSVAETFSVANRLSTHDLFPSTCLSDLFSSPLQSPPGARFCFSVDLQVTMCMAHLRL
jgi:hypothetical protein